MATVTLTCTPEDIRRQLEVMGISPSSIAGWDYFGLVLVSDGTQVEYHPDAGFLILNGAVHYSAAWL